MELLKNIIVSRETLEQLQIFCNLLIKWQKKINLISSSTIESIWERHIEDSLQLLNFINNPTEKILDIGSGAGFPGIVLAISGIKEITLVESDSKKCAFLIEAAKATNILIKVYNQRIEKLPAQDVDILTARGVARINKLLIDSSNHIHKNTRAIFLKGSKAEEEIQEAAKNWNFKVETHTSVTNPEGVVVILSNIQKRI